MNLMKTELVNQEANTTLIKLPAQQNHFTPEIIPEIGEEGEKADVLNINKIVVRNFKNWMRRNNLSDSTITSYTATMIDFQRRYKHLTKNALLAYRQYLIDNFNPRTANQRINGINKYLEYSNKKSLRLKSVRIQNKPFLENVITKNDYNYFLKELKREGAMKVYFIVKFIACTGVRPSELIKFRVDHVEYGWMDIYSKGGKIRRIYIPTKLQQDAMEWLKKEKITCGTIFKNEKGETITTRGINKLLKDHASKLKNIPLETIYAYSFRHFFAKSFLEKNPEDILLLADLMGHSSLETTRIYTRMTTSEQRKIVCKTVDW